MPARHDLNEAKQICATALDNPTASVVYFIAPSRSLNCVMQEFSLRGTPIDPLKAKIYILESIQQLDLNAFSHRSAYWESVYDVYGYLRDDIPWYVKFGICEEDGQRCLEQVSFHRIESDLKLETGQTLKVDGTLV